MKTLRPIEAFLIGVHPEAVERGVVLLTGQEIEFGKVDGAKVRKLLREHRAAGQEALKQFNRWLVREQGLKQSRADDVTAVVWNAMCMTFDPETRTSNPIALIDRSDETYSYSTKMRMAHCLHHWARYYKDSVLYEKLLLWMRRKPKETPEFVLEQLQTSPPYTRAEYRRLLKAIEEYKGSPRFPWAWSCLRLTITQGIPFSEILYLDRSKIIAALAEPQGLLKIGRARTRRAIQVNLIEQELRYLLSFPFQWNLVGDIVDPIKTMSARASYSPAAMARIMRQVLRRAKITYTRNWHTRARWSAAWQYYQKTGNLVSAAQILGYKNMYVVTAFFDELKKREKTKARQEDTDVVEGDEVEYIEKEPDAPASQEEVEDAEALDVEAAREEVGDV